MLTEICADLRNYFCQDKDKHFDTFTISGGSITPLDFLKQGQYFRIVGSTFNDGVHLYPTTNLTDETFNGAIWAMNIPPAVVVLSNNIKEYVESDMAKPSAYTSESFGGYSYSKAVGKDGAPLSWQTVFANRLNPWRKIR